MSKRHQPIDDLTVEYLNTRFHYDRENGILIWKMLPDDGTFGVRYSNGKLAGKTAGGVNSGGYFAVHLFGRKYRNHRLIWILETGSPPAGDLDHRDGDRTNNRFSNLRVATQQQNSTNQKRPITNKSGVKGVHWNPQCKKWRSQIRFNNKQYHLGLFATIEEASAAYYGAATKFSGEFVRQENGR